MGSSELPTEQRADIEGSGNVIVQILGNDNRVDLGRPYLRLTRYLTRRERVESDADLLSPYARAISLVGREREMAELRAWLASGRRVAVRVMTGRAGAGKTRLALELCDERVLAGWAAGFVTGKELRRFQDKQTLAEWGWSRPTLIVADYAAEQAKRLGDWFDELIDNPGNSQMPLRILLLERHAEAGSGWWQTAFGRGGFGAMAVQKLLDPREPVALEPLAAIVDRRSVIGQTLKRADSDEQPPAAGSNPSFDSQLAELSWGGEPLFLMMAGLVAKEAGLGSVLSLRRTDLAFELADRELARIARIAEANGVDQDFLLIMAGYVTLCRGLGSAAIRAAVRAEQGALGLPGAGDPGKIARLLALTLPGGHSGAAPILPDMVGEAASLRSFARYEDHGSAAVCRAFASAGRQVAATVIRTAQDFATAGDHQALLWLGALLQATSDDTDMLFSLAGQIPTSSLVLAGVAMQLYQQIERNLRRDLENAGRPVDLVVLTVALNNLSNKLIDRGHYDDAVAAAEESVQARRLLFQHTKNDVHPSTVLASSLITLANTLCMRQDYDKAIIHVEEAVSHLGSLIPRDDEYFCSECAQAFTIKSNILSHLDRDEEATFDARTALSICRFLHSQHRNRLKYHLHYIVALTNLSSRYLDLKKPGKSHPLAAKAVTLIETLAVGELDSCLQHWALCLMNLANSFLALGRDREARKYAREGAQKYQEASQKLPRLNREFAFALATLANCEDRCWNEEAALAANHKAIHVYSKIFFHNPNGCVRDMKLMISQYLRRCTRLGCRSDGSLINPILAVMRRLQTAKQDLKHPTR
jgi:tetratricopeptide (TPR) repeat protein